jgi:hypothetical protein
MDKKDHDLSYIKSRKYERDSIFVDAASSEIVNIINGIIPGLASWATTPPVSHDGYHLGTDLANETANKLNIAFCPVFDNWKRKYRHPLQEHDEIKIIGEIKQGLCLLVDDVATSGNTIEQSINALRNSGASVFPIVYIYDRVFNENQD